MSSTEQEPTLGEILRGQARIEKALEDFIEDQRKQNHVFRNAMNATNVAIALHTQKLEDVGELKRQMESVTAKANGVSAIAAFIAVVGAWLVSWLRHS